MEIYGSPCSLQVYDTNLLIVSDIPRFIILNHPVEFTVDSSKVGNGQVEASVNDGKVPCQIKASGKSKYHFKFIPTSTKTHSLSITYNGRLISGNLKKRTILFDRI